MTPRYYRFKSRSYSMRHTLFALFFLMFGCFISENTPSARHPMAIFLSILVLWGVALASVIRSKGRLSRGFIGCSVIVLLLASAVILSGSPAVVSVSFLLSVAMICYMASCEHGNQIESGFSDYILLDIFRAVFLPFRALIAVFDALFNGFTAKGAAYIGKIFLGIIFAVVPTAIVTALLSFDSGFRAVLESIFTFGNYDPADHIWQGIFGILIGMYLFGLFIAASAGYHKGSLDAAQCDAKFTKMKVMPQITALSASLPILFIYVVFFISQWEYYISGFTGILPESFSYAEYAREGFFQLCAVSVINLIILVALSLFTRRGLSGKAPVLKVLTCIFCLFTLVLIATAVAKLVMYIQIYGMTLKRLYAMWAMIVIAVIFLITAAGQFLRKFKTVAICLCAVGILLGMLCLCNANALVAQYNVDRYLSGTLQQLDMDAMEDLGVSAVPALAELIKDKNTEPALQTSILEYLLSIADGYAEDNFNILNYGIPDYIAMHTLRELALLK